MAQYEVGSIANFVSQTTSNLKNNEILNDLFSSASNIPVTVKHLPVPTEKKVKRNKRQTDQYNISSAPKGKKQKKAKADDEDDEEVDAILNAEPNDDDEDEDDGPADTGRKQKKLEMKNASKKKVLRDEDMNKVVLVKNLPIKVKRRTIHNMFAKFGKVDAVWLRCAALADPAMPKKVAVIKQEFHPDRQSISAFVRFEDAESAQDSLALTGTQFQDQHIAVSLCSVDAKRERSKAIFVGNLPFGVEDEALWVHFAECGRIEDVRIVRDKTNGMGKGFGYVNFDSPDSVELAMKLNGSSLKDREIRVERCKNKPKAKNPVPTKEGKNDRQSGAYRRVQEKNKNQEGNRKSGSGWISKMKQRNKSKLDPATKLQSFAGETVTDGNKMIKEVKSGKIKKKSKEEIRKKVIASKLTSKRKEKK